MQTTNDTLLQLDLTADELVLALLRLPSSHRVAILDSCGVRNAESHFLIAGVDPVETVAAYGDELHVRKRGEDKAGILRGSVLSLLDDRLERYRTTRRTTSNLPASGACIAAFAYDLYRQLEGSRARGRLNVDVPQPDAVLAFFDALVIHDYSTGETHLVSVDRSAARLEEITAALLGANDESKFDRSSSLRFTDADGNGTTSSETSANAVSNFSREEYLAAVERIRRHIFAGDIYQANLTQQITCVTRRDVTPERVFLHLRREHPAEFAAFMRLSDGAIVSASPERFLRVRMSESAGERRIVEAWPIKGTRPRGRDRDEDARLRAELLGSGKDAAENIMIVDLMRNDLGRVCRYGSVEVAELCVLQELQTLFHLVSKVRGEMREGVTAGDLLRAAFPSGSITGAPKIRAMEILDEIETADRGFSMGALGYFGFDGVLDLSVAIRTITFGNDGAARLNVGGGIVAESDPAAEYEESLLKARALLRALGAHLTESVARS